MGKAITTISSGSRDSTVGLFFTNVEWRTSELCDLDTWRWSVDAACAGTDPEAWFPHTNKNTRTLRIICDACPVKIACLETALEQRLLGWWGGTSEHQRRAIRAARRADG